MPSKTTQSCYSLRVVASLGLALSQTRPSIVEFHLRAETQCLAVSYRLHAPWMVTSTFTSWLSRVSPSTVMTPS